MSKHSSRKRHKQPVVELGERKFRLRKRMSNLDAIVALETGEAGKLPMLRIKAEEIGAYEIWIVDPVE